MFFTQFGLLFTNMEWFVAVCLVLGVTFVVVEACLPGFGFFGVSGITCLVASIVLRAVFHAEEDIVVIQVFQFMLFYLIIFGLMFLLLFIAYKKGWLKKSPLFHTGTAVDEKFSDGTKDLSFLVSKQGEAATMLRPSGKIEIDGVIYEAESTGFFIEKGEKIVVTAFENGQIKVNKINQ